MICIQVQRCSEPTHDHAARLRNSHRNERTPKLPQRNERTPKLPQRNERTPTLPQRNEQTPEMEKQSPPPAPACKQSGDTVDACPSCGLFPDDPSFCLWLNHRKIHQALAIPGAPCAQGASEQESARIFAEVTWKVACGGISPAGEFRLP